MRHKRIRLEFGIVYSVTGEVYLIGSMRNFNFFPCVIAGCTIKYNFIKFYCLLQKLNSNNSKVHLLYTTLTLVTLMHLLQGKGSTMVANFR